MNLFRISTTLLIEIDLDPLSEIHAWLYFIFYLIVTIVVSILTCVHTNKLFTDLCTENRSALSHRHSKPALTFRYKLINYLSAVCLVLIVIFLIAATIQMADSNYEQCVITAYLWTYPWILYRGTAYCIFFLRLDVVYSNSAYGYNQSFIYLSMTLIMITSLVLPTIFVTHIHHSLFLIDNDEFPNPCYIFYPLWGYTSFLIYDFIINVLGVILFIIPLRKVIKATNGGIHGRNIKMIKVGIKLLIISSVWVVTAVTQLSVASLLHNLGYILCIAHVVNALCIMLMTPYYPDDVYYNRLCHLCLLCAPKKYRTEEISSANSHYNVL